MRECCVLSFYENVRDYVFKLDPERAHLVASSLLQIGNFFPLLPSLAAKYYALSTPQLSQSILGLDFINPVGLAAGFDKNAQMFLSLSALGFSHIEVGAITPKFQEGNPKPRVWRYVEEESLQNAMGFNNLGANKIAANLQEVLQIDTHHRGKKFAIPLGANLGKNKSTPQEKAIEDYIFLAKKFAPLCSYLTINLSSPNTPNLRDLQDASFLKELFSTLRSEGVNPLKLADFKEQNLQNAKKESKSRNKTSSKKDKDRDNKDDNESQQDALYLPIFLKLSPDLANDQILELAKVALEVGISGLILTNTTQDYSLLPNMQNIQKVGGLSGKVLQKRSAEVLQFLAKDFFGQLVLISSGGIFTAEDAYWRLKNGASLVQIYTSLIFKGPSIVRNINTGLVELLHKDGYEHIQQAIGADL